MKCNYNPFALVRQNEVQRDIETEVGVAFEMVHSYGEDHGMDDQYKVDPFWENAAKCLMLAVMYYVYYELAEHEKNYDKVFELVGKATDIKADGTTEADPIFSALATLKPDHIAVRYWKEYASGSVKVKKDVASTLNEILSVYCEIMTEKTGAVVTALNDLMRSGEGVREYYDIIRILAKHYRGGVKAAEDLQGKI